MRSRSCPVLLLTLLFLPFGGVPWVSAQTPIREVKVDCGPVLQKMRDDFATEPGRLLLALEDALTTSEPCACSIVRTAVDLAGREPEITVQILITALRQLPASAARISECILQEAPAAAPAIRAALARELGEKSPELLAGQPSAAEAGEPISADGGKNPVGKNPLPPAPEVPVAELDTEAGVLPSIETSGIYISSRKGSAAPAPSPPAPRPGLPRPIFTIKNRPLRPILPATSSTPD